MVALPYVPARGDIVWLSLNRSSGHEQTGRRPALVLSPVEYNRKTGLMLACPITSRVKGYPFEVVLPADLPVAGVVLSDQIRSLSWRTRGAKFVARLPDACIRQVLETLETLLND